MALSQIQCLDDNNVNPRTHESKVEFFYCEDQRLALQVLLRDGREAFVKYVEERGLRGFLSDLEQDVLLAGRQPYDPGSELLREGAGDDEEEENTPLSLHYWPDLSDTSIPQMDLGWPDSEAYRGVTRTSVYTQPPMEGQTHVKEVVRKMIAQAQKVIAVVMDVFTDVDIFRDLMDAGYKKKVSVYILLDRTHLPHFLSMCQRANMHTGHLKHIRVRCTQGAEFHTQSCTKVTGRMGHRFMFIDGDKAVSGSYGFTWMSSRLDRNLITVTTGQAVDGFDRLFRFLYANSSLVDLKQVAKESEPEPEHRPQPTTVAPPSADIARKLYNPKYALVAGTNPSPTTSVGRDSPKEPQTPENPKKKRRLRNSEEEAPPLHPGLVNLEKAYLIPYLPTWPEPDPSSDVIGFINIRDTKKPTQVHLQRSEMFETSQAIRFSSPFSKEEETLPEIAIPRQLTAKHEPINKPQQAQINTKTQELVVDRTQNKLKQVQPSGSAGDTKTKENTPEQIVLPHVPKSQPNKDPIRTVNTDNKLYSYTAPSQNPSSENPSLSAHTGLQSSSKAPVANKGTASHTTHNVSTNRPKSDPLHESNVYKGTETVSCPNKEGFAMYRAHTLDSNNTQTPQLPRLSDSNSNTEEVSNTQASGNVSTPSAAVNSTFHSQKNHIAITTVNSGTTPSASVSTTSPSSHHSPTSPLTTLNHPHPTSSSLTSPPPVPKPRTVQLLIKDDSSSNNSQVCLVRKPNAEPAVAPYEPPGHSAVPSPPLREPQTVPQLQGNSASKTEAHKYAEDTGKPQESLQQTKGKEPDGHLDGKVRTQLLSGIDRKTKSEVFVLESPKIEIIPKDNTPKTLISMDKKIVQNTETEFKSAVQTNTQVPDKLLTGYQFSESTNEKVENGTQPKTYLAKAHEPQSISYYTLTTADLCGFEAVDSLKETKPTAASTSRKLHISKDNADSSAHAFAADTLRQGKQAVLAPAQCMATVLNTPLQSTHSTPHEANPKAPTNTHTPEKQLPDRRVPELHTLSPEQASRPTASPVRTPTPDRFLPRTPTPDSQMPTLDLRTHTPDFPTPTPDVSDGYISPREDSNLSTTSEEYFECSDSPFREPVLEHLIYHKHGTTEDHVISTHENPPNASSPGTSPTYLSFSPDAASSRSADSDSFWSEAQTLSGPARGSSSSVIEKRAKIREAEDTATEENGKGEDEKGRKVNAAGRRAELESLETERRDSEEADRIVNHLEQGETSTETATKGKEVQVPRRKRVQNPSAADRLINRGVTAEARSERTELKRLPSSDLKPGRVTAEGKGPDKVSSEREKLSNLVVLKPKYVERREKSQFSRGTEEQKPVHTPAKTPRVQQQDIGLSSSSRPPRPPRPLSGSQFIGARPWGSRPLNQTESRALELLEGFANKPPSRPPLPTVVTPAGAATGRKQVSPSQQGVISRQPSAGQSRTRAGLTQSQTVQPKPQASFLHTHSNMESQLHPTSQSQQVSTQEASGQEEGKMPFSFTFSKLYSLRGLKEKMGKAPAQGRKSSSSSPAEARKSTS